MWEVAFAGFKSKQRNIYFIPPWHNEYIFDTFHRFHYLLPVHVMCPAEKADDSDTNSNNRGLQVVRLLIDHDRFQHSPDLEYCPYPSFLQEVYLTKSRVRPAGRGCFYPVTYLVTPKGLSAPICRTHHPHHVYKHAYVVISICCISEWAF